MKEIHQIKKSEIPIPIYRLALLQAYLYEIFATEKKCEQNFRNTEWYISQNFSKEEIDWVLKFFKEIGLKCDCDIIKKIDLRKLSNGIINYHK